MHMHANSIFICLALHYHLPHSCLVPSFDDLLCNSNAAFPLCALWIHYFTKSSPHQQCLKQENEFHLQLKRNSSINVLFTQSMPGFCGETSFSPNSCCPSVGRFSLWRRLNSHLIHCPKEEEEGEEGEDCHDLQIHIGASSPGNLPQMAVNVPSSSPVLARRGSR